MKFQKKYLLVIPAFVLAGLIGVGSVSASGMGAKGLHGFRGFGGGVADPDKWAEQMNQNASLLGISVDEMKTYWVQGKNIQDIALEKGITQEQLKTKMQSAAEAKIKLELQSLVNKGYITQAQADARFTVMQEMKNKMGEKMKIRPQMKRGMKFNQPKTAPVKSYQ
ncbi:MAG: hypothetical protein A2821_00570 [Candidatus Magasanikbacteria bacterium RIFCSPHIGHO2_01_FULL_41_23]|uniref:DUF2680 domain-containing protein n=1 Tax=Candidatus Magasanikbacteria bacterium RIFCSPLOWO2_01_FULL_40_15 TaxID=1798686 RepID=A0A1F6N0H6_9BACT|nr:MAG: hypothetical protein A2821_00570 [Candidatus Magasanikbacteria bacterium RIFCSPHIGHO2_01_FULL_41_23]OGH74670.1 MAG: hypothetical protein A3F22_01925 [Candidatus Magasanikbacteria bacterium RIFCSPHIGHO2_12_FULL_41_16]OGH77384.1 MAG: hypothetical protein A2983_01625 [Candidatus Magasanikbacteria bacterium RIFCSPLOWO2_01_FULL_40_15]